MKTNQIDVIAFAMFGHFEQIEHTQETRLARQLWSNIGKPDQCNRIDLDLSLSHAISLAFFYMGGHPYSDAAGYFPSNHSFAKALCEDHHATPFLAIDTHRAGTAARRLSEQICLRRKCANHIRTLCMLTVKEDLIYIPTLPFYVSNSPRKRQRFFKPATKPSSCLPRRAVGAKRFADLSQVLDNMTKTNQKVNGSSFLFALRNSLPSRDRLADAD
jgi:hypothetical protein